MYNLTDTSKLIMVVVINVDWQCLQELDMYQLCSGYIYQYHSKLLDKKTQISDANIISIRDR